MAKNDFHICICDSSKRVKKYGIRDINKNIECKSVSTINKYTRT